MEAVRGKSEDRALWFSPVYNAHLFIHLDLQRRAIVFYQHFHVLSIVWLENEGLVSQLMIGNYKETCQKGVTRGPSLADKASILITDHHSIL